MEVVEVLCDSLQPLLKQGKSLHELLGRDIHGGVDELNGAVLVGGDSFLKVFQLHEEHQDGDHVADHHHKQYVFHTESVFKNDLYRLAHDCGSRLGQKGAVPPGVVQTRTCPI